jgi:GNAT superfamily N-acetyltransferase
MTIREAEPRDIEEVLVLGWEMHQESRYKTMEFSLEKVAQFFQFVIDSPDYIFLVVEKNSRVVGGFIGYAMPQWFSDDLAAGDFALFIDQENRGGTAALKLVKKYIEWAKSKGVASENIGLGITTGIHTEKTQMFYERLGFEMTGLVMNFRGDA